MNKCAYFIPDKAWFKIDEVCTITGVKEYIIRFWEKEFIELGLPDNNEVKNFYSRREIEVILQIKTLLFDKKLTVDEAKMELNELSELPPEIKFEHAKNEEQESCDEDEETNKHDVTSNYIPKEEIAFLSNKLGAILRMTDNLKSVHNWH